MNTHQLITYGQKKLDELNSNPFAITGTLFLIVIIFLYLIANWIIGLTKPDDTYTWVKGSKLYRVEGGYEVYFGTITATDGSGGIKLKGDGNFWYNAKGIALRGVYDK